jgi:hypothetical protein
MRVTSSSTGGWGGRSPQVRLDYHGRETIMAVKCVMAMKDMPEDVLGPAPRKSAALGLLVELFRRGKWRARREHGREGPDLLLSRGDDRYALELKFAVESRRDRLVPLLAASRPAH